MGNAHINFAQQILAKRSNVSPFQIEFFFGKMKVASHQLEYGLYSLECLVMVYVRVYY